MLCSAHKTFPLALVLLTAALATACGSANTPTEPDAQSGMADADPSQPDACSLLTTCEQAGHSCGSLDDGCGQMLMCGSCTGDNMACNEAVGACECAHATCNSVCCEAGQGCDNGQCVAGPWHGVSLEELWAPDEYTVKVTFSSNPGAAAAQQVGTYSLGSPVGALVIQTVAYDADAHQATLTTERQKLGARYTLTVDDPADTAAALSDTFLAADTARFWATNFASGLYDDYEVIAYRDGVGTHVVTYVQQGYSMPDTDYAISQFDTRIYPTLTEQLIDAPDFDENQRILLLALDGGDFYGGYFSPTNQYPDADTSTQWGVHSNEMDMVYINATMNTWNPVGVVSHEFSHLLYQESHGLEFVQWNYHNEGLAEVAVHLVYGVNQYSLDYFCSDPGRRIGNGLPLVHWSYALYSNYVQAYTFWVYLASRAGDLASIGELFNLASGSPSNVAGWISSNLGSDLPTLQRDYLLATWIRASTGIYGYNGFLDFSGQPPRSTVAPGTTSLDLASFSGAFFPLANASVSYPGTQGSNLQYVGVNGSGQVDLTEPFDVNGGALLVFNTSQSENESQTEHSGPDQAAQRVAAERQQVQRISPAWLNPPPVLPTDRATLDRWRVQSQAGRAAWFQTIRQ